MGENRNLSNYSTLEEVGDIQEAAEPGIGSSSLRIAIVQKKLGLAEPGTGNKPRNFSSFSCFCEESQVPINLLG